MAAQVFAVVCAWCNQTVQAVPSGSGVTQTICPSCADWSFTHQNIALNADYFELPPRPSGGTSKAADVNVIENEIAAFLKR
jgi:hypothetical protein